MDQENQETTVAETHPVPRVNNEAEDEEEEEEILGQEHDEFIPLRPSRDRSSLEGRRGLGTEIGAGSNNTAKRLTFMNALGLLISLQIGSGIFAAPAQISRNVQSPGYGVLVWLLAGILAWTGANSFTELGMAIPLNGGIQEYLRECYGDVMACVFSWTWILISKAASNAAITAISADYFCTAFSVENSHAGFILRKILGFSLLWAIGAAQLTGPKAGANLAIYFLVLKIFTVMMMVIMGLAVVWHGKGRGVGSRPSDWLTPDPTTDRPPFMTQFSNFVTALFGALFTINGWESISFVVGDLENPARILPRVIASAMSIITCLTVLLNTCIYMVLPMKELRDSNTPALLYVSSIAGPVAGLITSIIIAVSVLGTLNGNIFAVSALCVVAGQRGYLPFFGKELGGRWAGIPIYEIFFNTAIASVYLFLGSFDTLVVFIGTSYYFFYFFTALGVFILRSREGRRGIFRPTTTSAYRTGTWNPIIFCLCSAIIILRSLTSHPFQAVVLGIVGLVSFLLYKLGVIKPK